MFVKSTEKILGGCEHSSETWGRNAMRNGVTTFWQGFSVSTETCLLFSRASEKFSVHFTKMFKVSERYSWFLWSQNLKQRVEKKVENGTLKFWKPWICKDEKKLRLHLSLTVRDDFATEFYSFIHQTFRFNNFKLLFGKKLT